MAILAGFICEKELKYNSIPCSSRTSTNVNQSSLWFIS